MAPKGEIDLSLGVTHFTDKIQPTESSHTNIAGLTSKSRFAYRFTVSGANRLYKLAADSQEEMEQWVGGLERAVKKLHKGANEPPEMMMPEELKQHIIEEAPEGEVTFVFTDVQSSTHLWETAPDAMDEALALHDTLMRKLLKKYRGYEVKTEGDAFMVAFFSAIDALLWCLEVQKALAESVWPVDLIALPGAAHVVSDHGDVVFSGLRIRMGIGVGYPNCRKNPVTGRMDYFGPIVNLSARVSDTAHGGQVVITQQVYEKYLNTQDSRFAEFNPCIQDKSTHWLKGIKEKVQIYEVLPSSLSKRSSMFPPLRSIPDPLSRASSEVNTAKEKSILDVKDDIDDTDGLEQLQDGTIDENAHDDDHHNPDHDNDNDSSDHQLPTDERGVDDLLDDDDDDDDSEHDQHFITDDLDTVADNAPVENTDIPSSS